MLSLVYLHITTFAEGRGFIQHPEISPVPHGLAVFHQLHCLVSNMEVLKKGVVSIR
jgi:hypothetical protein